MLSQNQLRKAMVDTQIRPSDVTKFPVISAMLKTPRECFVPENFLDIAYVGENIALKPNRVILDPRISAKMLDALDIQPDETVLDIGSALGCSAAILAHLAGFVIAVEEELDWAERAQKNLVARDLDNVVVHGGSLAEGFSAEAPYTAIMVEGGIEVLPPALGEQLAVGGRIVALFKEGKNGVVRIGHKTVGGINWRFLFNATAPLLPGFEKETSFNF